MNLNKLLVNRTLTRRYLHRYLNYSRSLDVFFILEKFLTWVNFKPKQIKKDLKTMFKTMKLLKNFSGAEVVFQGIRNYKAITYILENWKYQTWLAKNTIDWSKYAKRFQAAT